jgi:predicted phosphohydrolase
MAYKTQLIGLKEFRQGVTSLWKKARKTNTKFIVMYHSQPVLEVHPISEKEDLLDKLKRDIAEAREQVKKGKAYTQAQVFKSLGL